MFYRIEILRYAQDDSKGRFVILNAVKNLSVRQSLWGLDLIDNLGAVFYRIEILRYAQDDSKGRFVILNAVKNLSFIGSNLYEGLI